MDRSGPSGAREPSEPGSSWRKRPSRSTEPEERLIRRRRAPLEVRTPPRARGFGNPGCLLGMSQRTAHARETSITTSQQRHSFEDLYRAHVQDARKIAYLSVGDPALAEDIVQEAFIRVLGRFGDMRKPSSFKSYLLRTVLSLCKNHFRRTALERSRQPFAQPSVVPRIERDDDLLDALRRLPYRQRAALVLRYCEDLTENDTAEILQTSTKAVQSLVARGLTTLRKEVER